jgi:Predicted membrane protein (DUF2339)
MEGLSALLLVALIIIVVIQNSNLKNYLLKLEREIKQLQKQLQNVLLENVKKPFPPIEKTEIEKVEPTPVEPIQPVASTKPYVSIFSVEEREQIEANLTTSNIPETIPTLDNDNATIEKVEEPVGKTIEENIPNYSTPPPIVNRRAPEPAPLSFFEKHPDMEKFIGENLVSKIGIAILVLAIGFFVKYAIDQNWIGPVGRVSIGLLCGGILIGLAHKMRNSYRNFSSVFAGGGIAVFYFTITLAHHQFHLFGDNGQVIAFGIMLVITSFAVILSILYDKQELAVIALLGGFVAPFLVSSGSGNYISLFVYLIILNSGLLVIAYYKSWRLLNLLSFIFTVILFGSWLVRLPYETTIKTYSNGFIFAAAFYVLYFAINVAYNVSEKKKFVASDFGILLANTSLFFAVGIYCLYKMGATEYKGLFSACMAIFNLAASYFLFRKQKMDTNVLYLLIGITLTFISITAPLQLNGNFITLFWASEAVLLIWLFTKSKISIIQYASLLVWVLMMISLFLDWINIYTSSNVTILAVIINKAFITGLFASAATYLLFVFTGKEIENEENRLLIKSKNIFRIIALVVLFLAGLLEINYQFSNRFSALNFSTLYIVLYIVCFVLIMGIVSQKFTKIKIPQGILTIFYSVVVLVYLTTLPSVFSIQQEMLLLKSYNVHLIAHWFTTILTLVCLYKIIFFVKENNESLKDIYLPIVWLICGIIVIVLSVEGNIISNQIFYNATNTFEEIRRVYVKTGLPILWGVCSFAFMWLGMRYKFRTLRIISLSLFSLTLFKLFAFDIKNIPIAGKIAAFFCLGVLLLVVSFMYQRLKKIIIDDEKKTD